MKYILTLFCLVSFVAYGQEPAYTPMRLNYQFRGIKIDSLFLIPSFNDTTAANNSTMKNVAGAMIRTGNDFYMRNATTNAWLQNVNVGTGASPSIQFVDSVWRVAGKDSIFWRKGGTTNKIKDSTVTDSPDRIDGTATAIVDADMQGYTFKLFGDNTNTASLQLFSDILLSSSDSLRFEKGNIKHNTAGNKYEFKDFNNTFLIIDTLGGFQAGDLTKDSLTLILSRQDQNIKFKSKNAMEWTKPDLNLTSKVKTAYTKTAIDLSGGNDTAFVPGTYIIDNADTNIFFLPDATKYAGQTVYMIVKDDAPTGTISALSGTVYQPDENAFPFKSNSFNTFTSDGADWWGAWHQP